MRRSSEVGRSMRVSDGRFQGTEHPYFLLIPRGGAWRDLSTLAQAPRNKAWACWRNTDTTNFLGLYPGRSCLETWFVNKCHGGYVLEISNRIPGPCLKGGTFEAVVSWARVSPPLSATLCLCVLMRLSRRMPQLGGAFRSAREASRCCQSEQVLWRPISLARPGWPSITSAATGSPQRSQRSLACS